MRLQHTPAPWGTHLVRVQRAIYGPNGQLIAYTIGNSMMLSEAEHAANARLIAAAPELLVALDEAIQHEWNPFEPDNQSARYHRLVALRVKATGSAS